MPVDFAARRRVRLIGELDRGRRISQRLTPPSPDTSLTTADCLKRGHIHAGFCAPRLRVQLSEQDYDPDRSDSVRASCRSVITYHTDIDRTTRRMVAIERDSIARNDRLGQSVRVDFDVHSRPQHALQMPKTLTRCHCLLRLRRRAAPFGGQCLYQGQGGGRVECAQTWSAQAPSVA